MKNLFTMMEINAQVRYFRYQKLRFLNLLIGHFEEQGRKWFVNKETFKIQFGRKRFVNLFVDPLKKAKILVVAGYDTPVHSLDPRIIYYPVDNGRNQKDEIYTLLLQLAGALAVTLSTYFLLYMFPLFFTLPRSVKIAGMLLAMLVAYALAVGVPNRNNYNRNTAADAVLTYIIGHMGSDPRISYCYLDGQASGPESLKALAALLERENPQCRVLLLDCIGRGRQAYAASNGRPGAALPLDGQVFRPYTVPPEMLENSPCEILPRCTVITCATLTEQGELAVTGTRTRRDQVVDLELMQRIGDSVVHTLRQMIGTEGSGI